jgi:protein-S-isoprenylcysteine O-methyltransferase Ste14
VILFVFGVAAFVAFFTFIFAGTFTWTRGWLFIAVFVLLEILAVLYVCRTNPEFLDTRIRRHQNTERWSKVLKCFFVPSILAVLHVAALDDVRFHWLPVPDWVCVVGYAVLAIGMFILAWVGSVTKFVSKPKVIDTGPYAIVRHPGYVAAFFWFSGIALALGSLWALIPAAVASLLLVVLTQLKDRTLQNELEGYKEYAERVRYRLIPGMW